MIADVVFEENLAAQHLRHAHELPLPVELADQMRIAARRDLVGLRLADPAGQPDRMPIPAPAAVIGKRIARPIRVCQREAGGEHGRTGSFMAGRWLGVRSGPLLESRRAGEVQPPNVDEPRKCSGGHKV